jgi:prepilin-type processing-associated H-X9-DG protein
MSASTPPRLSRSALAALLLGLLPLSVVTGIPALLFGWRSLRDINTSDGRLSGRPLAIGAIVLGLLEIVVTVVGFVLVLLFQAQATAARTGCANNFRQIGLAIDHYYQDQAGPPVPGQDRGHFPQAAIPNAELPPERRLSWYVSILPYLGQVPGPATSGAAPGKPGGPGPWQALSDRLDRRQAWDAAANTPAVETRIPQLVCPALLREGPHAAPGLTTYVGLAGIDPNAAELGKDNPRAGVFGYYRIVSRHDVTAGISYTMLATETMIDLGPWAAAGPSTVRGLDPEVEHYVGPGRLFGGLHAGGANVLYVDTSVRFVSDAVPAAVFRSQATLGGKPED